ncbi:GPW/gp25 family protein [Paraburkholderia phenazinium]|uniref:GPW/gp25 family protein n=1 Tax=Paraburkholderia phenazinium TaxID=60549 RepID=UPI00158AC1EA|nr:GPW/gp25 family protein [Paraburkholderia phenazinium]
MKGMDAKTGRSISGLAHLYQSIGKIVTTSIASRLKRRPFGSEIPDLIDAPNNGATRVRAYAAIATALMRWEPRLTLSRVQLVTETTETATGTNAGAQVVDIEGTTRETGDAVSTRVQVTNGKSGGAA